MTTRAKVAKEQNQIEDIINQRYIQKWCKGCKYYKDHCTKKRLVRECIAKGLKNKDIKKETGNRVMTPIP